MIRPAISAPLPWLAMLAGRLMKGRSADGKKRPLFKFPRSLSITREGKWYIGILLVIGVAAINTGNNLLYLVVATLLSLIIISGIMSEATLRGVKVHRSMPPYVFKGAPSRAVLKVTNTKKLFPSYSFKINELEGQHFEAYVLKLASGGSTDVRAEYTFPRRGIANLSGLRVSTKFPFGLFTKGKVEEASNEVLVLPSVGSFMPINGQGGLLPAGQSPGVGKGEGGGLYGLREYTLADDARHIHWKSAGRTSRLLLKEFEEETEQKVIVVLENRGPAGDAFEELVDRCAGTVNYYIEKGFAVGLKTLSSEISPGSGIDQLIRVLRELAFIGPEPGTEGASVKVVRL